MTLFNGLISGIDLKAYQEEIDGILTRVADAENSITTLNGQVFINIKGDWNALTNVPNLLTIVKKQGDAYKVSIAGSTDLDGETDWKVNDLAVYGADNKWFKIDNTQFSEINDSVIALNTTYSSTKIDLLLNTKVDKITGKALSTNDFDNTYKATLDNLTENVQDIMSTTLVDTSTVDFVYDDENNNITANIKDVSILNAKIANNANIETSKIKQTTFVPLNDLPLNGDLQDVVNNKFFGKINNLQDQINSRPVGASNGSIYYFTSQDSTIPNYELLSFSPDPSILDIESITVNVNTIKEDRLIHSYISNYDIGATVINGGVWSFNLYGYVSHLNNSNFEIDVLKRAGTVETVLFTVSTTRFLETTQISPDKNIVNGETYQQDFTCNATDKIVIKIYGKTDRAQNTTITLLHSGTDYASHVHTPLIATHDQLAGIQGDGTKHISSNQLTILRSLETVSADKVMITDNLLQPKTSNIVVDELNHLAGIEENIQIALNNKQRNIIKVNNQTEMLGLSTAIVGDIVIRTDDNNYQYRLNALPASSLSNWEVLGKDAQPVGETVDDIITTNEVITSKPNGLYAFAGIPNGGLPSGVLQGDIALKTGTSYTIAYTFINAPSTIFSKSDSKIYKKTINGSGINTWEKIPETTLYEVGAGKGYVTLQSAVDSFRSDFLASKVLVGNILIYDSVINESVTIANDVQNLLIEGFGVSTRGNTQIQSITVYGHRLTFKNIQVNAFVVNSTGTISEYGVTIKRGKHIFDGVVFANNTTAIDVQGISNFLTFKDCDFNSKPIAIANNPSASPLDMTTISIDGCANGTLNCGTNRLVTKNNSLSIYQGTITGTILDVDGAKPIAYSILRSYSALGLSVPVALKTLIINDDAGGTLQLLKCTTAYTIAGAAGVGTAIDLTKYQIQTDSLKVSSIETATVDNDLVVFSGTTGKVIKKTTASNFKSSLSLSKNDVGLGNVDNTSDTNKPVSTATQTALNSKEPTLTKGNLTETTSTVLTITNGTNAVIGGGTTIQVKLGATAGTVCEGNDARLGTRAIDEASIANNKILVYNSTTQKLEYQDKPIGATNLSVANKTSTTLDIVSDTGSDATLPASTTTEAGLMSSADKTKLNSITGTNTGDETISTIYTKIKSNIIAGSNVTIDTNDVANTITINSTGGGGETQPVGTLSVVSKLLASSYPSSRYVSVPSTNNSSSAYPLLRNVYATRQLQIAKGVNLDPANFGGSRAPWSWGMESQYAEDPVTGTILTIRSQSGVLAGVLYTVNNGVLSSAIYRFTDTQNYQYNTTKLPNYSKTGNYDVGSIACDGTYFILMPTGTTNDMWRITPADLVANNNWTFLTSKPSSNGIICGNGIDTAIFTDFTSTGAINVTKNGGSLWTSVSTGGTVNTNYDTSCGFRLPPPVWNGNVWFVAFHGTYQSATSPDALTWTVRSNLSTFSLYDGTGSYANSYLTYYMQVVGGPGWSWIIMVPSPTASCNPTYGVGTSWVYSIDNGVTFRYCYGTGRHSIYTGDGWIGIADYNNNTYYYSTNLSSSWQTQAIANATNSLNLPAACSFVLSRKTKTALFQSYQFQLAVTYNPTFNIPPAPFSENANYLIFMKAVT